MDVKKRIVLLVLFLLVFINLLNLVSIISLTNLSVTSGAVASATGKASLCFEKAPTITSISDQTATVDTAFSLQVDVTFYGSNTSISYADNTSLFNIDGNGLINFTPALADVGTESILITVEDSSGCLTTSSTDDFKLTISEEAEEEAPAAAAGGGGGGGGAPSKKAANLPFKEIETEVSLKTQQIAEFSFGGEMHSLKLISTEQDKATIEVSSETQVFTLNEGEEIEIDLDNDEIKDLYIKLESTSGKTALFKTKSLRLGLTLSEELLKVNIPTSQELKRGVFVLNDWGGELDVIVTNPLSNILVSPEVFNLKKGLRREISFILNPDQSEPNVYVGAINFLGKDNYNSFSKSLTVILEVVSDGVLFDLSIDLFKKTLFPKEELEAAISIFNPRSKILEGLELTYTVMDLNNNQILQEKEIITLEEQASFSKKFALPKDIQPGKYVFSLKAVHQESIATSSEIFTVESTEKAALAGLAAPITRRSVYFFGLPLILILVAIIFAALHFLHRKLKKTKVRTIVKRIIKQKTIIKRLKPKIIIKTDTSKLKSKLYLLKESYHKGYITEKTYQKTKRSIEQLIRSRK